MKKSSRGALAVTAVTAVVSFFVATFAAAQAPAPAAPAKDPAVAAREATSPAGGSANPDTKAKAKGKAAPKGPTPHLLDGKVDLSGMWNGGGPIGNITQGMPKGAEVPLQPWAAELMKKRLSKDDPEANCLPTGVPRIAPYPWRIVQTPTHIFFLFEGNIHSYRQIFVDGRKHPADPDPTWYGHSIGTLDGDTLTVDTVGYNDLFWFDFVGHPHTTQLHTVEKYTRKDLGTLAVETLIDDPGAYTKSFTLNFTATLRLNDDLMEYICQENNVDVQHIQGPSGAP